MTKIPSFADIIADYSNQDKTLEESAADLGAIILEMEYEKKTTVNIPRKWSTLKSWPHYNEQLF